MKVTKRAFESAIEHLHPTRNVRDMIDQLGATNHFASSHCIYTICSANENLQNELSNCKTSFRIAKRAFECATEHLHPTKVLEQRANQDLRHQGHQPIGVCRF
jgi:hypothetical protein